MTPDQVTRERELEACNPVLFAALRRIGTYLAKAERLKMDTPEEVLAKIRQEAHLACEAQVDLTQATFLKGMEFADEEVLLAMHAYGYQMLEPTAKIRALAALKRQARDGVVGSIAP